jgi:hypothetical protein
VGASVADLIAPLPIIRLFGGMTLRLEAIDATTGAAVAGVRVADVAIYGRAIESDGEGAPLWEMFLTPIDS